MTKTAKKKARKFAHEVKMKIRLRTKGPVAHMKAAKPRKRDRLMALVPGEMKPLAERRGIWKSFIHSIRTKMKGRIEKREAAEKAKRTGNAVTV